MVRLLYLLVAVIFFSSFMIEDVSKQINWKVGDSWKVEIETFSLNLLRSPVQNQVTNNAPKLIGCYMMDIVIQDKLNIQNDTFWVIDFIPDTTAKIYNQTSMKSQKNVYISDLYVRMLINKETHNLKSCEYLSKNKKSMGSVRNLHIEQTDSCNFVYSTNYDWRWHGFPLNWIYKSNMNDKLSFRIDDGFNIELKNQKIEKDTVFYELNYPADLFQKNVSKEYWVKDFKWWVKHEYYYQNKLALRAILIEENLKE